LPLLPQVTGRQSARRQPSHNQSVVVTLACTLTQCLAAGGGKAVQPAVRCRRPHRPTPQRSLRGNSAAGFWARQQWRVERNASSAGSSVYGSVRESSTPVCQDRHADVTMRVRHLIHARPLHFPAGTSMHGGLSSYNAESVYDGRNTVADFSVAMGGFPGQAWPFRSRRESPNGALGRRARPTTAGHFTFAESVVRSRPRRKPPRNIKWMEIFPAGNDGAVSRALFSC